MATYSLTETAKLIRQALKAAFPDTKFSVTSKSYSGGCSIDVRYTDGPLCKDVDAIATRFEGANFDGMTDCKYYNKPVAFNGQEVTFAPAFVFVSRRESDLLLHQAAERVAKETGLRELYLQDGALVGGEFQCDFNYIQEHDVIADGKDPRICGGEWYSQLVYQVARNTTTPHQTGKVEVPQQMSEIGLDQVATATIQ